MGRSWYLLFCFPPTPGPLGLLGVAPKHKLFLCCLWYPDLLALRYPRVPPVLGGCWLFWRTFGMGLKKYIRMVPVPKLETQVWFWFRFSSGSRIGSSFRPGSSSLFQKSDPHSSLIFTNSNQNSQFSQLQLANCPTLTPHPPWVPIL